MSKIEIIEKESISTGRLIHKLIQEHGFNQTTFSKAFGEYVNKNSNEESQFPRKTINEWCLDKSKPHKTNLKLLADFFSVDVAYLECNQAERKRIYRSDNSKKIDLVEKWSNIMSEDELKNSIKELKSTEALKNLLESMGITLEFIPTSDSEEINVYQVIQDSTLYTLQQTSGASSSQKVALIYPDNSEIEISNAEYSKLVEDLQDFCSYKINKLKAKV